MDFKTFFKNKCRDLKIGTILSIMAAGMASLQYIPLYFSLQIYLYLLGLIMGSFMKGAFFLLVREQVATFYSEILSNKKNHSLECILSLRY